MGIEAEALQAAKDFLNNLSEEQLQEKNSLLKSKAQAFLSQVLPQHEIIVAIQTTIANNGDWLEAQEKLSKMIRGDFDTETLGKWHSFTSQLKGFDLKALQQQWDAALRLIYDAVDNFQNFIFEVMEIQDLAYITVQAKLDKEGNINVGVFEFDPSVAIDKQAASKGGGLTARVGMGGRKTKQQKAESFQSIIDKLKSEDVSEQEISTKYQKLANTYKEVLIRFAAAKAANGNDASIWWFTDASQDDIGGMVKATQRGDLAEAFVSFIPQLVQQPGERPPYTGVMDPTDVAAFLTVGVANVDNAKGRLVGDVMARLQNGSIQNWAVKAAGASHMGYQQMIELADIIRTSSNPLESIGETQYADALAGVTRNAIVNPNDSEFNQLKGGIQKAIDLIKEKTAQGLMDDFARNAVR